MNLDQVLAPTPMNSFEQRFAGDMWDRLYLTQVQHQFLVLKDDWWTKLQPVVDWFKTDTGIVTGIGLLCVTALLVLYRSYGKSDQRGNGAMKHWERQQYLKTITSDLFTDVVEQAYFEDKITKAEKFQLYAGLAKFFELPDLICMKHPSRKKAESRRRRTAMSKIEPHIPGDPPPQVERKEEPVRNRMTLKPRALRTQVA